MLTLRHRSGSSEKYGSYIQTNRQQEDQPIYCTFDSCLNPHEKVMKSYFLPEVSSMTSSRMSRLPCMTRIFFSSFLCFTSSEADTDIAWGVNEYCACASVLRIRKRYVVMRIRILDPDQRQCGSGSNE